MVEACSLCAEPATQRCSRCRVVYYCSREHQRMDWGKHKCECSPYKVRRSKTLGRHLVAARALRPGETVLRELPLVTGPLLRARLPVCVACYRALAAVTPGRCERCGWTLCQEEACRAHPRHRPECDALHDAGKKVDVESALAEGRPVYRALTVARCLLLRDSNPEAWKKLLRLEAHCARRQASGQWEQERREVAAFLLPFLGLQHKFSEEDVLFMCGVVQVNTYPVLLPEPAFVAIYDEASFIEHSCVPNTSKVFGPRGELLLKTAGAVGRGEHLAICYVDPRQGTAPRRAQLAAELLNCFCPRCRDPTELGSGFSALACPKRHCEGSVFPQQPISEIDSQEQQNWQCETCKSIMMEQEIEQVLSQAHTHLQSDAFENLNTFLTSFPELGLGPNHYMLLPVRVKVLCSSHKTILRQCSDNELRQRQKGLQDLLELVKKLLPADSGLQGTLLFELTSVLLEEILRKSMAGELHVEDLHKHLDRPKLLLAESVRALDGYSIELKEGLLLKKAQRQLEVLQSLQKGALGATPIENPQFVQHFAPAAIAAALAS